MRSWWGNVSVSNKLFSVVGLMAFLIAVELATLSFAMNTLSAVRSFVGGEGLWSKAQKTAVHNLQYYAFTGDEKYYREYKEYLKIPLGDRQARLELIKPNPDHFIVTEGFAQGGIHRKDIPGLIEFIQRFYNVSYVNKAINIWTQADALIDELVKAGDELHENILRKRINSKTFQPTLQKISDLDKRLTVLENDFSFVLGEGSRWLERLLMTMLLLLVCTVEVTGLYLTFTLSRNLGRSLKEINNAAKEVGLGNFDQVLPVRSNDEIGLLAAAINKMSLDLKNNIGQRKAAEASNQVKTMFLANMSHEIRTPLGVILGLVEILKSDSLKAEERRQYIDIIHRTGKSLSQIINDILDISRVEAGYIDIDKTMFSLPDLLNEIYEMMSVHAAAKENKITFTPRADFPQVIVTDRSRLRQILVNILNNAVKFTRRGSIEMSYWADTKNVYFEVSDNGIGMTEDQKNRLFEMFYQGDSTASRKYEGTGLGLALSKRLAKILGGDVELLKSQEKKGSSFLVTVPLDNNLEAGTTVTNEAELQHGALSGKKILIVEDNKDNQLLLGLYLQNSGASLEYANNGEEGYNSARNQTHDLVLMDIQMPIMDGYTAVKKLRSEGYKKPIIAVTAHAMKNERSKCLEAGCTDFLPKPVSSSSLASIILKYLN